MSEDAPRPGTLSGWRLGLLVLAALLAIFLILFGIRRFGPFPTYRMSSATMEPSLSEGDVVMVKGARAFCGQVRPEPGDVVVYRKPGLSVPYMHRVVAGPGQTAELRQGRLWIDGRAVPARNEGRAPIGTGLPIEGDRIVETLPNGRSYATLDLGPGQELDDFGPVPVPADRWLILGDSRDNAMDSRVSGLAAASDICATGLMIVWSEDEGKVGRRP